jgi:putative iron-only hydrogenase system regulator
MNDAFSFLLGVFYFGNMQTLKWRVKMDKRIGVVGIVVEDINSANEVNAILHDYSHIIVGRMGIPYREKEVSVISLIVDGSSDEISAMTGKLGRVKDVSVKSAMAKKI